MFARGYEFGEALELVTSHGPISSALERQIGLEVGVKVLLEGEVAYEAHAADAALEFDPLEDLYLRDLALPITFDKDEVRGNNLLFEGL